MTPRAIGIQLNKLRRYQLILDLYNKYKTEDIPTTVVWRKYIYPVYPISRTTLYEILSTPVKKQLIAMEKTKVEQTRLF